MSDDSKSQLNSDTSQSAYNYQRPLILSLALVFCLSIAPAIPHPIIHLTTIFGVPLTTIWLTCCFLLYAGISVAGYLYIFRHWSSQ